jgi:diguanylate cyclase (GGDEF)-like protein
VKLFVPSRLGRFRSSANGSSRPAHNGARKISWTLFAILVCAQLFTLGVATLIWGSSSDALLRNRLSSELDRTGLRASEKVSSYLAGPEHLRDFLVGLVPTIGERNDAGLERAFLSAVATTPNITGVFLGRADGTFLFVTRQGKTFLTKQIAGRGNARTVQTTNRTSVADVGKTSPIADDFDPRTRPWFKLANANKHAAWTDVYQFATSKKLGITTAVRLDASRSDGSVLGIDLELSELSMYVRTLDVGNKGVASLLDRQGRVLDPAAEQAEVVQLAEQTQRSRRQQETNGLLEKHLPSFHTNAHGFVIVLSQVTNTPGWTIALASPESEFFRERRVLQQELLERTAATAFIMTLFAIVLFIALRGRVDGLANQANIDQLTGMLNRRRVVELARRRLERERRDGRRSFVCLMDIDNFKSINDSHGHSAGDRVLQILGQRFSRVMRTDDLFGRYGGEEFFFYFDGLADAKKAFALIERVRVVATEEPIIIGNEKIVVTLSAGIAVSNPEQQSTNLSLLIEDSDAALYEAKRSGRDKTIMFGSAVYGSTLGDRTLATAE